MLLGDLLSVQMTRDAARLRALMRLIQRFRRIVPVFGTWVLGNAQVREVFERDTELRFGAPSDTKMKLGPFILGMDDSPQYRRQKEELRRALRSGEGGLQQVAREVCEEVAAELANELRPGREVDLLARYVDPVVTRFSSRFYGVPFDDAHGKAVGSELLDLEAGEQVLGGWLRVLGAIIVSGTPAPFGLEEVADAAAEEFLAHLKEVAAREAPPPGVIARLGQQGELEPSEIASSVGGLMLAGRTVGRSFLFMLHQLLRRPDQRDRAAGLARGGTDVERDELLGYVLEALRFQPPFAFLPRYAARATTLATGTEEETRVGANRKVLISPMAAMLDPRVFDQPDDFNPYRERELYLHYATGRHVCLGDWIANGVLTEMAVALLREPTIGSAEPGVFRYRGPIVSSYRLAGGKGAP